MDISFANTTIERLRASERESRGSIVQDWTNPTSKKIDNCFVKPTTTGFDQNGRLAVSAQYTVLAPKDADILAADRIVHEGETYQVQGVEPHNSPTGAVSHLRVTMEVWHG